MFMIEVGALRDNICHVRSVMGDIPAHVVIPLLGCFKNEDGEKLHLMLLVSTIQSGLKPCFWVEKLLGLMDQKLHQEGPAFCDSQGRVLLMSYSFM